MTCPGNCSWSWRKLFGLRSLTRQLISNRTGDGHSTSFWFDNWHLIGPMVKCSGCRIIIDFGLGRDTRLSS